MEEITDGVGVHSRPPSPNTIKRGDIRVVDLLTDRINCVLFLSIS